MTKLFEKKGEWGIRFSRFETSQRAQKRLSENTVSIYENAWKFLAPAFEPDNDPYQAVPTSVKEKERMIVERIEAIILERMDGKKPLSASSINIYTRVANTFLKWLHEYDDVLKYRWTIKKQSVETGATRDIFTEDEITKLRLYKPTSLNQKRTWTMAMMMLDDGMRIAEALSLTLPAINFDNDMIYISNGKGKKSRYVEITPALKPILFRYVDKIMPKTSKFIFGTLKGTKLTSRNALRDISVVLNKAKVRVLSWHCFRHTYATGYLVRGGRIEKLQKILGHSKIETTQIYLHMAQTYYTQNNADFSSLTPFRGRTSEMI
jgi:site-specific recombinase XerD